MQEKNQNAHEDLKVIIYSHAFLMSVFFENVSSNAFVKNPTIVASQKAMKPSRCFSRLVTITSVWSPEGYYFCGWRVVV